MYEIFYVWDRLKIKFETGPIYKGPLSEAYWKELLSIPNYEMRFLQS